MFLAGAAVAFLLARNCDLDATAGAWPPRGARAAAQRPARLPDGYHHTLRCMVAFRGTMAANAWRAEGKRERSVSLGDFCGWPAAGVVAHERVEKLAQPRRQLQGADRLGVERRTKPASSQERGQGS